MGKSIKPPPPRMAQRSPQTKALWLFLGLLLLAGHIGFFTQHTDRTAQTFNQSTVPPNTIEGIPEPRFFLETDSYAWLAHTRDLMNSDDWRIRHTFMDNAPYGREMHWSHLLIWTLRGMTTAIMTATEWPVARALELAGVWVMPLFQFLFLSVSLWGISRKMGVLPAAGFTLVCLTYEPIAIAFSPLKPDHHAFQLFFVLASFVCLQFGGLGWVRTSKSSIPAPVLLGFPTTPEQPEARQWMIASGVFGGLALWVGATVWLISLAIISLAMLPALPLFHRAPKDEICMPGLWRTWAASGCLVSLACYLLEYTPHHFSMRLEVNHPLYWVSWIGVALGLEQLARLRRPLTPRLALAARLAIPGLLALALPVAILLGPAAWHHMHDPFMQRLHGKYIVEFLPSLLLREGNWLSVLATFRAFLIALPWVGILLFLRRARTSQSQRLLFSAFVFVGLFFVAGMLQQRWGFSLAAALVWLTLLLLTNIFAPGGNTSPPLPRLLGGLLVALILLDAFHSDRSRLRLENNISINRALPESWIANTLKKRNALQWGLAAGTNQWRFAGMAPEVPLLYYFSGIPSVASYYWENTAGWQAEAALLADVSPAADQALAIARERGLTHLVSSVHSSYPEVYFYVATGIHDPTYAALHTLDGRLTYEPFTNRPAWTVIDEPLSQIGRGDYIFKTPDGYAKERLRYQVFAIQPTP